MSPLANAKDMFRKNIHCTARNTFSKNPVHLIKERGSGGVGKNTRKEKAICFFVCVCVCERERERERE